MNNQTLHRDRKRICCYYFQSFGAVQTLERHVNDYFEVNLKQMIEMAEKVKLLNSKKMQEKYYS